MGSRGADSIPFQLRTFSAVSQPENPGHPDFDVSIGILRSRDVHGGGLK
jgi:hypothetical protein